MRGDDEKRYVSYANFCSEVLAWNAELLGRCTEEL